MSVSTETKLKEYPVNEKEVHKILTQVNVTRRECEIVCMFFSLYSVRILIIDQVNVYAVMKAICGGFVLKLEKSFPFLTIIYQVLW